VSEFSWERKNATIMRLWLGVKQNKEEKKKKKAEVYVGSKLCGKNRGKKCTKSPKRRGAGREAL
jgi:hypothetical protein